MVVWLAPRAQQAEGVEEMSHTPEAEQERQEMASRCWDVESGTAR